MICVRFYRGFQDHCGPRFATHDGQFNGLAEKTTERAIKFQKMTLGVSYEMEFPEDADTFGSVDY
jgi:hypothetical protein